MITQWHVMKATRFSNRPCSCLCGSQSVSTAEGAWKSLLLTQIRSALHKAGKRICLDSLQSLLPSNYSQQAWYNSLQWFLKLFFPGSVKNHCQAPYTSLMYHWSWAQELLLVLKEQEHTGQTLCPSPSPFSYFLFLNFLQDSFISVGY